MNKIMRNIVLLGIVAASGALLYRFGLSDEARRGVRAAARSVRDACDVITDQVNAMYGQEVTEDVSDHQNDVLRHWERLGF